MTATTVLEPLTSGQARLFHAKMVAAYATAEVAREGIEYGTPEYDQLSGLWSELHTLSGDALTAGSAARERETSAEVLAAGLRLSRLDAIARAEQLLAAERRPA